MWGLVGVALWCQAQTVGALQREDVRGAEELWNAGERSAAIDAWSAQLTVRPTDNALRRRLAEAELAVHRYAAALQRADGLGAELDFLRGTALFRLGEFERALQKLGRTDTASLLMRIDCLESLARFDEVDAEIVLLAQAVGERDAALNVLRGRSAARRGENAAAEACFRRALEIDPLEPAAMHGLGTSLVRRGERDEGLRWLTEHRRITPLLDQLDFARRSIDLAPSHGPNHAALGDAERALGRAANAELAYRRASELAKKDELAAIVLRHARVVAEDLSDVERAVRLLDSAYERCSDVRLLVRAGDLLLASDRRDAARVRFEAAAQLRPNDGEIQKRLRAARGDV